MKYRSKMSKGSSKRLFTSKAMKISPKNLPRNPMRGGIRL
nr:MAG: hypothetical protein [Microvirus sp.]